MHPCVCVHTCVVPWGPQVSLGRSRAPRLPGQGIGSVLFRPFSKGKRGCWCAEGGGARRAGLAGVFPSSAADKVVGPGGGLARKLWDVAGESLSWDCQEVEGDRPDVQDGPWESCRTCSFILIC